MPFSTIYNAIRSKSFIFFASILYYVILHQIVLLIHPVKITTFTKLNTNIVLSFMITSLEMVIAMVGTSAALLWFCRDRLSIRIDWWGVEIVYLSYNHEEPAKEKLMTEKQVLNFPEIRYKCNGGIDDSSHDLENPSSGPLTCSICIEDFEEGELVRVMPCGHHYHTDCIMPWLTTRSADCPVCKQSFVEDKYIKKDYSI